MPHPALQIIRCRTRNTQNKLQKSPSWLRYHEAEGGPTGKIKVQGCPCWTKKVHIGITTVKQKWGAKVARFNKKVHIDTLLFKHRNEVQRWPGSTKKIHIDTQKGVQGWPGSAKKGKLIHNCLTQKRGARVARLNEKSSHWYTFSTHKKRAFQIRNLLVKKYTCRNINKLWFLIKTCKKSTFSWHMTNINFRFLLFPHTSL